MKDGIYEEYEFWDNWIGTGIFDKKYLTDIFRSKITKNYLVVNNEITGILIYKKKFGIYIIDLLSKNYNSKCKGIGKMFINFLKQKIKGKIILSDDSGIPNYYINLGFSKTRNFFYKFLLNDFEDDIYILSIS